MGLFNDAGDITASTLVRPGQTLQTGDIMAQAIAEYGGHVEHTIERKSVLHGWLPLRSVRGTNTVQNYAVGETTLQKVDPGVAPASTGVDFSKANLVIDTLINARNVVPLLESFQTQYDARQEVGIEHGRKIAKFYDQAFFIQAAKAGSTTASKFGAVAGHAGGSQVTLTSAGDATDPARLYAAIKGLNVKFQLKDIDPATDDMLIALRPDAYSVLADADQIVNGDYKTSEGNTFSGIGIFKALGVPVVQSNNVPNTNVTGHLLSNSGNSNAYDGDFTKLVGVMFSARALLAGETIPLTSDVFYDKTYKCWFVDSHMSFGVTGNRHEYAGVILKP